MDYSSIDAYRHTFRILLFFSYRPSTVILLWVIGRSSLSIERRVKRTVPVPVHFCTDGSTLCTTTYDASCLGAVFFWRKFLSRALGVQSSYYYYSTYVRTQSLEELETEISNNGSTITRMTVEEKSFPNKKASG